MLMEDLMKLLDKYSYKMLDRLDGRIELVCPHGVGHTAYSKFNDYVHGCDSCCDSREFTELKELLNNVIKV